LRASTKKGVVMYPGRFEYVVPESVDEAVTQLANRPGGEAKVLADGQSLIPLMKLRFASPAVIVDVNRIDGLAGVEQKDGYLRIGALVRHKDCERSDLLRGRCGVLGSAAAQISDPIVRNLGTVCGSIAHADPQGDWGSALLAANARVIAYGPSGTREIGISEFFLGPFTTTLQGAEVVTEVRVPDPGPRTGGAYLKLERKVGDFATAAVAVQLELDDAGRIARHSRRDRVCTSSAPSTTRAPSQRSAASSATGSRSATRAPASPRASASPTPTRSPSSGPTGSCAPRRSTSGRRSSSSRTIRSSTCRCSSRRSAPTPATSARWGAGKRARSAPSDCVRRA